MDLSSLTSVIFNDVVNETQVCYHLVYPKHFNLIKKTKRIAQASGQPASKKRRRRGRPRKEDVKQSDEKRQTSEETANDEKQDANMHLPCSRTRYGRVSRPPKHMSKFVEIKDARTATTTDINTIPAESNEVQYIEQQPMVEVVNTGIPEPKKMRKNVDRFTCGVCKKVYLGRKKMLKHHLAFPDHKTPQDGQTNTNGLMVNGTNSFLFDELMKVVGRASQTERIAIFLAEISNFANKVRLFKSKMLDVDVKGAHPTMSEYYVDKNVSKVLDLPEGLLQLNDRAFDDPSQQNKSTFSTYIEEGPPVDTPPMNNLPPLGYNLNLFPQVNYDQISDNAVEAEALGKPNGTHTITDLPQSPILDINLDLFSFDSIK